MRCKGKFHKEGEEEEAEGYKRQELDRKITITVREGERGRGAKRGRQPYNTKGKKKQQKEVLYQTRGRKRRGSILR